MRLIISHGKPDTRSYRKQVFNYSCSSTISVVPQLQSRTVAVIMIFTMLILPRCSTNRFYYYSDALLSPLIIIVRSHQCVIRQHSYHDWKRRSWRQSQPHPQRRVFHTSIGAVPTDHLGNSSLLLDDLLNDVLKNRPMNNDNDENTVVATSTSSVSSLSPKNFALSSIAENVGTRSTIDNTITNRNNHNHGWRCIDWASTSTTASSATPPPPPSPVEMAMIRDRLVYIKRDDQVRCDPDLLQCALFRLVKELT